VEVEGKKRVHLNPLLLPSPDLHFRHPQNSNVRLTSSRTLFSHRHLSPGHPAKGNTAIPIFPITITVVVDPETQAFFLSKVKTLTPYARESYLVVHSGKTYSDGALTRSPLERIPE
jgi:hypothetical protein